MIQCVYNDQASSRSLSKRAQPVIGGLGRKIMNFILCLFGSSILVTVLVILLAKARVNPYAIYSVVIILMTIISVTLTKVFILG